MTRGHEIPSPVTPHAFDEPAARPARRRPIPVKPLHVRLHVEVDPEEPVVRGRVFHTLRVLGDAVTQIPLDAEDLVVHSVTRGGPGGPQTPLEHVAFAGGISVRLDEPSAHGDELTICLEYTATPSAGLYFVGPDAHHPERRPQAWTQGAMEDHHRWFPCFDAPEHMITSEVIADVPAGYVAVSNGVPVEGDPHLPPCADRRARFHWRHDTLHALYLITLVVDTCVEVRGRAGEVTLHHYVPPGREGDARELFCRMGEMLSFLGEATGRPYPYPRYGHAFLQNFMWGGMENTTLTSLTDVVLVEGRHRLEEDVERLIAHELAHQWFGDLIAPRGWTEIWLNESFATYFEQLCMQALEGDDDFWRRMQGERDSYLSEARERYARPVVVRSYADPYVLFDRHAYEKGCLVLHTLRDQLGDAAFFRGVRAYVARMAGKAAETCDLRRAFEEVTGADLHPFFEQWVYGASHPRVKVGWSWHADGGLQVRVDRLDEGDHEARLTLAAHAGGALHRWRVPLTAEGGAMAFPLDTPPAWVALDPEQACLVEIDEAEDEDGPLLARLLGPEHPGIGACSGGEAAGPVPLRVRTIRVLARRARPHVTRALARALGGDPSPSVRIAAAKALGAHRTPMARAALRLALAEGAEGRWRVRAAAARALGAGGGEPEVRYLAELLDREGSHRVRCGALGALGEIKTESARAVIRLHLDADSPRDCVSAAAVQALAAHEEPSTVDELCLRFEVGHPRAVRMAAANGLARLGKAAEKPLKERCRKALEAALTDANFAVRLTSIRAVATLGDEAATSALRRAHGAEGVALLRRYIRESLGKLEAGGS